MTFGCQAKTAIPNSLRSKTNWDSKFGDCILIGYFDTENLYELWDIANGTSICTRDVVFWEHVFGHESLRVHTLASGVSILPIPIAQPYAEQHETTVPNIPPERANVPLPPLNQGDTVPTIPKAPPEKLGLTFIPYEPPHPAPIQNTLPLPQLNNDHIAALVQQLNNLEL